MALAPRLDMRQAQSLTLTPQLMQSIRLLQLSHLELGAFVEAELERNPLLERDETSDKDSREDDAEGAEPPEAAAGSQDAYEQGEAISTASGMAEAMDTDASTLFPEQVGQDSVTQSTSDYRETRSGAISGQDVDFQSFVAAELSLSDHLNAETAPLLDTPAERLIGRNLIDNLDEAGYLATDCASVAAQLGVDPADVERVLARLQGCDPAGVFARNVAECLAIQLREKDRLDPMMDKLLSHLDLVAEHNLAALCRAIGCDREDLGDMLAELRELDPRPGRAFDGAPVRAVVPDVFVRRGPDGGWALELNPDTLPRVLVNRAYYADVSRHTRDAAEKTFLVDCLQTANWLTKSLDQRAQTILKVAAEIVKQQDGFLVHGVAHLKPMTLRMVADAIEMHESTVSRVTANKYLATPRGLFEMKYFFTTALASNTGAADHSAESVRHTIRQLIDAEVPEAILSDDTIAEMLQKEQGIDVARRTVAKYREAMHIPSSVVRRRQKKARLDFA